MTKKTILDQMGRKIEINENPSRIVSLVPSLTELLYFYSMDDQIKGVTEYCAFPAEKTQKVAKVGGPKTLNIELIRELNPDLIIASKEENTKKQVEALEKEFPVWISDVCSLEDAYKMIEKIGHICNKKDLAQNLSSNIEKSMELLHYKSNIKVAYLIWENPYMTAGKNTLINDIINKLGFNNVFEHYNRYPRITSKEISESKADFILLPSEPYHFTASHMDKFKKLCPQSKILLVNGQFFSWYGNRLLLAVNYFKTIANVIKTLYGQK